MSTRATLSRRFVVDAPADLAFRFFTPAGEELWVDGWQPRYVEPADGRTEAGMVFTTGDGDEFTVWTLADWNPAARRSRYLRVTPASRAVIVDVAVEPLDAGRCAVDVRYTLTPLTPAGTAAVAAFAAGYDRMIDAWGEAVAARLPLLLGATIR